MNEFLNLNALYILLVLCAIIGGWFAGRRGFREKTDAAVDRLNEALGKEAEALRRRVGDLERDQRRQDRIFTATRYALREYHLRIVINHEFVTLIDEKTQRRKTATIEDVGKVTPIKSTDDTAI